MPDGPAAEQRRVIIEHVRPEIDGGRFPVKRVVGDTVIVEAAVFADGHDRCVPGVALATKSVRCAFVVNEAAWQRLVAWRIFRPRFGPIFLHGRGLDRSVSDLARRFGQTNCGRAGYSYGFARGRGAD